MRTAFAAVREGFVMKIEMDAAALLLNAEVIGLSNGAFGMMMRMQLHGACNGTATFQHAHVRHVCFEFPYDGSIDDHDPFGDCLHELLNAGVWIDVTPEGQRSKVYRASDEIQAITTLAWKATNPAPSPSPPQVVVVDHKKGSTSH